MFHRRVGALVGLALIGIAGTASAQTTLVTMNFTAAGFGAGAPQDPVSGTFTYDTDSTTGEIVNLVSVSLTISGHTYSLAEVGFESPYVFTTDIIGGVRFGLNVLGLETDDFAIIWDRVFGGGHQFAYTTAETSFFAKTFSFTSFSLDASEDNNDPPVAQDDRYIVFEGLETLQVPGSQGPEVLENDTSTSPMTARVVTFPSAGGFLSPGFQPDGSFTYVAFFDNFFQFGGDSFTYKAINEFGESNVATVTIVDPCVEKTSLEYAREALAKAKLSAGDNPTPIQLAREFYRNVILLRNQISSVCPKLRDLEYWGRCFSGALLARNLFAVGEDGDFLNDHANRNCPDSVPVYLFLKGILGQAIAQDEAPISEVGGAEEAKEGWLDGWSGQSLEEAIESHFGPTAPPKSPIPKSDGDGTENAPLLPLSSNSGPSLMFTDNRTTDVKIFGLDVGNTGQINFFDPVVRQSFVVSSSDALITGFVVDLGDFVPVSIDFQFGLEVFRTLSGQFIDFGLFGKPEGVNIFLFDIKTDELLPSHFLAGLRFASTGDSLVSIRSFDSTFDSKLKPKPKSMPWLNLLLLDD